MKTVSIQSTSHDTLIKTTNDFLMANILPYYNYISIKSSYDDKEEIYISKIKYENKR